MPREGVGGGKNGGGVAGLQRPRDEPLYCSMTPTHTKPTIPRCQDQQGRYVHLQFLLQLQRVRPEEDKMEEPGTELAYNHCFRWVHLRNPAPCQYHTTTVRTGW